jgi:DNA-binding MarR family transcriptional regulator
MAELGTEALDDAADPLARRLREVLSAGHEVTAALARQLDTGVNDLAALDLMDLEGPMGAAQLARRLRITTASATLLVDRLEAAGHAERRRDLPDRRRITVTPTRSAQLGIIEAMLPMLVALGDVGRTRTPEERETIDRYLQDVAAVLRDFARQSAL